jgi:hypothetical protein
MRPLVNLFDNELAVPIESLNPESRTSLSAWNAALHFLARPEQYPLPPDCRAVDPRCEEKGKPPRFWLGGSA